MMTHTIVLMHGFPMDGSMWRPQAEALRAAGHTVLTPSLPGFGGTAAWGKTQYSIEAMAEVVRDVVVREANGRAVVGGFSMGGYVLLALLRDFPEVVKAAMFIDTRPEADTAEARETRLKSIETVTAQGTGPVVEGMLGRLLSKYAGEAVKAEARGIMEKQSAEGVIGAQWAMSRRRDQTDLLGEIKVPSLVVVGDSDAITPPSVAMHMHNRIEGSMLVQIAHAGHLANLEQPEAVNHAIKTFLATVK